MEPPVDNPNTSWTTSPNCSGKTARIVAVYANRFEYHNAKAVLARS